MPSSLDFVLGFRLEVGAQLPTVYLHRKQAMVCSTVIRCFVVMGFDLHSGLKGAKGFALLAARRV